MEPQRKRRSAPKVRTGCLTCKIRRIKCDEARPHCARCIKYDMTCDGYPEKNAPVKFITVQPLAISIARSPSSNLNLDEQELRYFQDFTQDRFVDTCRKSLSSSYKFLVTDTFFWTGIVLRESHITPCTRHAIVAIGALGRSLHHHWQQDRMVTPDPHHEFALMQYHKALKNQRTAIVLSDDANGPRTALVACLVLAFFDMLYGHGAFAARHMEYGRKIYAHWRKKGSRLGLQLDPAPDSIDNISRLFLVLDLQASYLTEVSQQLSYTGLLVEKLPMEMPTTFKDMNEARYVGHLLVSKAGNFRLQTMHLEHSKDPMPSEVEEQRFYFLRQLELFHKAYRRLLPKFKAVGPLKNVHPLATPEALRTFPTGMWMRLTPGWGSPQTACDALTEQFEYMISMTRKIIEFEGENNKGAAAFCFEYRILPFLFFVATKCRISSLRREAISLMLSAHWREGIWDSFLGGKMATWIMEMEEEGMVDGYVPEEWRCWGETFSLDMASRTASIRCWQNFRLQDGGMGSVERRTVIGW